MDAAIERALAAGVKPWEMEIVLGEGNPIRSDGYCKAHDENDRPCERPREMSLLVCRQCAKRAKEKRR